MSNAKNLKMISRVGIGLDGVDLTEARKRGIIVSYTPDAPAKAVVELVIGLMITLLRHVNISSKEMHYGVWHRFFGRRLAKVTIGIIGVGRIGSEVLRLVNQFDSPRILINDIVNDIDKFLNVENVENVSKEEIYNEADIITLHLPLTNLTKNMITKKHILSMKKDAILINTARGGIINEDDLYSSMKTGHLSAAAIDVFVDEPYNGKLKEIDRCILTAHMGSMSVDCRTKMEIEATKEAIRFIKGEELQSTVPIEEYKVQDIGLY